MAKVLVVEDDTFLANAYRVKLAKAGFETQIAFDGEAGLAALEHFMPDVIVLDLVTPKKDGFSVLKELKSSESWKHIPVLVASNLGQEEDNERALTLGASDYVIKTDLSLDELVSKIRLLLPQ